MTPRLPQTLGEHRIHHFSSPPRQLREFGSEEGKCPGYSRFTSRVGEAKSLRKLEQSAQKQLTKGQKFGTRWAPTGYQWGYKL